MISAEQQYKVHQGDREAFKQLFAAYGKDVYLKALDALQDKDTASAAVKKTFVQLRTQLMAARGPMDLDAAVETLLEANIAVMKAGGAEALSETSVDADWGCVAASEEPLKQQAPAADAAGEQASPEPADTVLAEWAPKKERTGGAWRWVVFGVLLLALVWVCGGVLMGLSAVPRYDLGYAWFNEHVFPLFTL